MVSSHKHICISVAWPVPVDKINPVLIPHVHIYYSYWSTVMICILETDVVWGSSTWHCTYYMYSCLCGIYPHGVIAQTHLYFCSLTGRCRQNKPSLSPTHTHLLYIAIENKSTVRISVLETDVVCLVLHDCLDWQGHHPSHSISVNTQSKYSHTSPTAIGHAYICTQGLETLCTWTENHVNWKNNRIKHTYTYVIHVPVHVHMCIVHSVHMYIKDL